MLLLVCTVTVLLELLEPLRLTDNGEKLQVEPVGKLAQERAIVPEKPFNGDSEILYVTFCPAFRV